MASLLVHSKVNHSHFTTFQLSSVTMTTRITNNLKTTLSCFALRMVIFLTLWSKAIYLDISWTWNLVGIFMDSHQRMILNVNNW